MKSKFSNKFSNKFVSKIIKNKVGSSFSPFDISDMFGLYEVDDITTTGSTVTSWNDKSGGSNNILPNDAGDEPSLATAGDGINEIRFEPVDSGGRQVMTLPLSGGNNQSHFMLLKNLNNNEGNFYQWQVNRAALMTRIGRVEYKRNSSGTNEVLSVSGNDVYFTVCLVYNSASDVDAYYNGTFVLNFDPDNDIAGNQATLGGYTNFGGGDHAFRMLSIYEKSLSAKEIENLHNYAIDKWT